MSKIDVFFLLSPINDLKLEPGSQLESISRFLKHTFPQVPAKLTDKGTVRRVEDVPDQNDADIIFLVILSGGTEEFMSEFSKFGKPVFLQTSRFNNSLAAAIEGRVKLIEKVPVFLRHEEEEDLSPVLKHFFEFEKKRNELRGKWLTVGGASSWLVSSNVTKERLSDFGIELLLIESSSLSCSKEVKDEDELVKEKALDFLRNAETLIGVEEKDVLKTLKCFKILQELVEKHKVKCLTIRCIDLIMDIETSICLPVSLMNDEGVVTACEGDLRSLFGMAVGSIVADKPAFMGNLSHYDRSKKTIVISHCTIPRKLTDSYNLKTHFETNMGVSIHGCIKEREITVFSVDKELKNAVVTKGRLINCDGNDCLCRTQMYIEIKDISFVEKTFGNHQIVVYENYEKIAGFLEFIGIKAFVF